MDKVLDQVLAVLADHQVQEETQELITVIILDKVVLEEPVVLEELEDKVEPVAHGVLLDLQDLQALAEIQVILEIPVLTETKAMVQEVLLVLAVQEVLLVLAEALADITYKIVIT